VREEIRAAFLLGHHQASDPRTMWAEIPALLDTNRRIASSLFGLKLGELSQGSAADLVVYDYFCPTALDPENFNGHLLFGLYKAPAHTVVVDGRIRLQDGRPIDIDPAEVAARARERAEKLWSRF
jgi:cytosine/adenosine deaminase-related metal-dependent hydrolase